MWETVQYVEHKYFILAWFKYFRLDVLFYDVTLF